MDKMENLCRLPVLPKGSLQCPLCGLSLTQKRTFVVNLYSATSDESLPVECQLYYCPHCRYPFANEGIVQKLQTVKEGYHILPIPMEYHLPYTKFRSLVTTPPGQMSIKGPTIHGLRQIATKVPPEQQITEFYLLPSYISHCPNCHAHLNKFTYPVLVGKRLYGMLPGFICPDCGCFFLTQDYKENLLLLILHQRVAKNYSMLSGIGGNLTEDPQCRAHLAEFKADPAHMAFYVLERNHAYESLIITTHTKRTQKLLNIQYFAEREIKNILSDVEVLQKTTGLKLKGREYQLAYRLRRREFHHVPQEIAVGEDPVKDINLDDILLFSPYSQRYEVTQGHFQDGRYHLSNVDFQTYLRHYGKPAVQITGEALLDKLGYRAYPEFIVGEILDLELMPREELVEEILKRDLDNQEQLLEFTRNHEINPERFQLKKSKNAYEQDIPRPDVFCN